ncbi:MAG TPA: hypothetical protein VFE90_06225 [Myxococcales bacterium]|nr:hypothetical protein [Myxococcales bacterium]
MRWCALLLCLAAGCSRCGGRSAGAAEELLPQEPGAAVLTAPLGALGQHLAALTERVASLPGGEQLGDYRRALAAQLGFDPLTREGQLAAGLDPDRGVAVAVFDSQFRPEWVVALPLTKPDLFAQTIQRLMVQRLGASPGSDPHTFERGDSSIAWNVVRGYGMIGRGSAPLSRLAPPEKPEQSLAQANGLQKARKRLGAQDFLVWAPPGSALPSRYTTRRLPGDVALSVQAAAQGVAARVVIELAGADAQRAQATLPGGGASVFELLPADAPLRARLGIAPARLLETLRDNASLRPILDQLHGAEVEIFASLQPGAALSLSLARDANLAAALDYGLDWRRKSPFDTVQLVALAEVADRPRLLRALEQVAKDLPALGAKVARQGDDFQITYSGGRGARFGVRDVEGKPISYLMGGPLRPEDLRRTPRPADPKIAALYAQGGAAARIDFGSLAASVRELPAAAYGTGPQSYVTRSVVSQVVEPLRTLRVGVAGEAFPDRLDASIDLVLVPP